MPSQKTKTTRQSEVSNSSVWDAGLSMPDADNWMYTMPMSQSLETSNLKEIININDMNVTPKSIDSMQKSIHQSNPTGNSKEFNKAIIRIESSKKDLPAPQFDLYKTKF
ncbi:hypothetical protein A3Q56_05812 [Intoshia linei]|uniref:Uncharacterized protein n=1 Tax=Intoshia linei TaxID=1819745 RepID=A0A177AYL0_9BILA|nr:hypothetical protein A3Q56_05812 [Intoshia linei]